MERTRLESLLKELTSIADDIYPILVQENETHYMEGLQGIISVLEDVIEDQDDQPQENDE